MGLRIQNNISALNAHRQLTQSDSMMGKSLERLSSGYRINKAADDAAGLSISQSFRADIASYKVASRNVSEANAMAQVAEGAYDQIGTMLTRLKELATQASSANAGSNLDKINAEGNALIEEIDRIANSTEYAGKKLLNGAFGDISHSFTTSIAPGVNGGIVINEENGQEIKISFAGATDNTLNTTLHFDFGNSKELVDENTYYELSISGSSVTMDNSGDGGSDTFTGSISGNTISFNEIGLVITGDSALDSANFDGALIESINTGLSNLESESNAVAGTYTLTDDGAGNITITNEEDSNITQTITGVDANQSVNFDTLGISFDLGAEYSKSESDLNGMSLTINNAGSSDFQVGAKESTNDKIEFGLDSVTTNDLGISSNQLQNAESAQNFLTSIDNAIDSLNKARGEIGAVQNRLGYAAANLATTIENVQAAESVIRDVDMAGEMTSFTKSQILIQAGTAMLAQANMAPQNILSLIG